MSANTEQPCPFCESPGVALSISPQSCYVICHNCGATGPKTTGPNPAVEGWEKALRHSGNR